MYIKKITISLLLVLVFTIIFVPKSFAIADIIKAGKDFVDPTGTNEVVNETRLGEVSSKIYNILLACGIAAAVIVGAGLGIYYIMASAEGKAKIAETLVPYIIGCVVVFGAFAIWKFAIDAGDSIEKEIASATIVKLLKFS